MMVITHPMTRYHRFVHASEARTFPAFNIHLTHLRTRLTQTNPLTKPIANMSDNITTKPAADISTKSGCTFSSLLLSHSLDRG
jgi:hypothetical protein